jgi:anthranilate synthase component 2
MSLIKDLRVIPGLTDRYPKIQGVQFHPESIITESGLTIIQNWVALLNR